MKALYVSPALGNDVWPGTLAIDPDEGSGVDRERLIDLPKGRRVE